MCQKSHKYREGVRIYLNINKASSFPRHGHRSVLLPSLQKQTHFQGNLPQIPAAPGLGCDGLCGSYRSLEKLRSLEQVVNDPRSQPFPLDLHLIPSCLTTGILIFLVNNAWGYRSGCSLAEWAADEKCQLLCSTNVHVFFLGLKL